MLDDELSLAPWVQHYGRVPASLSYSDKSMWELVFKTVKKYPLVPALNYFGKSITYKKMWEKIECCARAFKALGIGRGDRVTICMPNTPEAVISFYAINMIGAVANMIYPLSSENEIRRFVSLSCSRVMVAISNSAERIRRIIGDTNLEQVIVVSPRDSMPLQVALGYQITKGRGIKRVKDERFISFSEFMRRADSFDGNFKVASKGGDLAVILYSGGTTGEPKGIMLSNLNFNALAVQGFTMSDCLEPQDRALSIMPIFHGFGLGICIHTVLYHGMTAIILPQFDIKTFHKLLAKHKPHAIAGVPTLYEAIIRNEKMKSVDLSSLKCAISGGDSLSASVKEKVDEFLRQHGSLVQVREGYGLTECVTGSCLNPKDDTRAGSIGIPYPDTFYKIVKPGTHEELAHGETGEICLSGPTVMLGYLDDEEETSRVLQQHDDGRMWLFTGDLGYMEADGYLYFKQRIKRLIVTSGYTVFPQNIEGVIDSHPDVLYSAVIGRPDEYRGQQIKAYVVLKSGVRQSKSTLNSIYGYCAVNVARYAIPGEFEFRDSLPKTLVGKVDYRALELENTMAKDEKMDSEEKKPRGRRYDAYRVRLPYDFNAIFPYLMKRRCDAGIYFSQSIDVEKVLQYIESKKGTDDEITFFQVFLLAAVKLLRERPELNRYVKGRRLYQRENVVLNFVAKREMSDSASETNVTIRIRPEDHYETILTKIKGEIKAAKAGDDKADDKAISALMRLPRFLLMFVFKLLDLADFYKGIPKFLESIDPIRCSLFIANLGSVGIDAPYHHLFEWGTNSIFVTLGKIKKMPYVEEDGTIVAKTMVDVKVSVDDRISDGFYFARSFDMFTQYLQEPEILKEV